jgi:hypothetical protein
MRGNDKLITNSFKGNDDDDLQMYFFLQSFQGADFSLRRMEGKQNKKENCKN